ncbi:DJ-1/PfpI family protein [Burkholderia cenocepacia]|uniref:DJ-1/PfpI family protein n=1 Tax=Burkholderia cenocepacia TaxID=95486 RepID=UPI001902E26D|nr:DJ-1/PfpI family protein [Burkholderia cenocepacia]MBJ9698553.1 DJ-1/PfpI family protein [Burkholderia cenocepacia]
MTASSQRFDIGMLIFDGMTILDFAGPFEVFSRMPNATVHVIGIDGKPTRSDVGGMMLPTVTIDACPALDMIFVGGGLGVNPLMEDERVLNFIAAASVSASWITSVCTGALLLGAAGLLDGYRAATHWTAMEVLPLLGAIPVHERVVIDRNRITGGGVTAGIDFGLTVTALLHGERVAQLIQLGMEYDPQPPFEVGSPRVAPQDLLDEVRRSAQPTTDARIAAARRCASRLSATHGKGLRP